MATLVAVSPGPAGADIAPAELEPGAHVVTMAGGDWSVSPVTSPRSISPIEAPTALAALPDGGFVAVFGCRLWRIGADRAATLVAGDGRCNHHGDGGPATEAGFYNPGSVAVLPDGGYLVGDGPRVRRINRAGVITTVAGNGSERSSGDNGPAVRAGISQVQSIAVLPDGGYLIIDFPARVRRVDPAGMITTVAGTGVEGFSGDGGPATGAKFDFNAPEHGQPNGLAVLPGGGFLVSDLGNYRIRRVGTDGIVQTVAGTGKPTDPLGDGGPAVRASFSEPVALLVNPDGSFLVGDGADRIVRRVGPDGIVTTIAGTYQENQPVLHGPGTAIFDGDGLPPRAAVMAPVALARDSDGGLLIANQDAGRVIEVVGPASQRASVAITGTHVRSRSLRIDLYATVAGQLRMTVSPRGRSRHAAIERQVTTTAGATTLALPRPPGQGIYKLNLTLRAPGSRPARSMVAVLLGPLTMPTARMALNHYYDDSNWVDLATTSCRRMTASRVDCAKATYPDTGKVVCEDVHAVVVGGDGLARFREYACPKRGQPLFRLRPLWKVTDALGVWSPYHQPNVTPAPLLAGPPYLP